jgi:hypothetical protein
LYMVSGSPRHAPVERLTPQASFYSEQSAGRKNTCVRLDGM